MPLSEVTLSFIVCPQCRGGLIYLQDQSQLICNACRLIYPVRDDIPVLLVEEAQKMEK